MKIIIFLLFLFVFVSCGRYKHEEGVSLKDSEIRLTLFHTTDIHSKILPFQFTPNSWDKKEGLAPQDPQAHCNCDPGYYSEGEDCKPITTAGKCELDSDCSASKSHCYQENNQCYECLKTDDCTSNEKCVNFKCVNKTQGAFQCEDRANMCSSHGKCYDDNGSQFYGGMARLAYILEKEKAKSNRWVYIDTGDIYQGAPIFNFFQGEPELRALSLLKVNVQTLGNHEFDQGINNWMKQVRNWTSYPLLAANYIFFSQPNSNAENQMPSIIMPYNIIRRNGLDIAVVGLANTASMVSIFDAGNSMGLAPEDMRESAQYYIDLLKDQVDLVVIASHAGLDVDQQLCKKLSNADVILGGHHHVVTDPPQEIINKDGGKCILVHSGVNLKFLGVLNLVLKDVKDGENFAGLEVVSTSLREIPIDNSIDNQIEASKKRIKQYKEGIAIPEELYQSDSKAVIMYNKMTEMLANYEDAMYQILNVDESIGSAEDLINRIDLNGGSSPLGNLVGDAMRTREFVDADFAITNSLGIRADLPTGPIKISKIFEIFPFNNSITTMTLSGREVQEMFDYVAEHSAERGCATQVQVSGIELVLDCKNKVAKDIKIGKNKEPLNPYAFYEVATNDYMARGGSGFSMLARVTTKVDTGIEIRNVVIDFIRKKHKIRLSDFEDSNRIRTMK